MLIAQAAVAEVADRAPTGVEPAGESSASRFRGSWLVWDNAVSAQTLGIGKSYQSANPTYETSLSLRPRYYLWERAREAVYVAGRIDLVRELTDSDVTTRRGETTLTDATLLSVYERTLRDVSGLATVASVALPVLTFPTSKFSYSNGTYLGLGTELRFFQDMLLAGNRSPAFQRLTLAAFAGYTHTFTRAVVPANPDLRRVRLDPEGRTVPGDQLTGAAFPSHEVRLSARLVATVTEHLHWLAEVSYRPTWKYGFANDVRVCGVVSTGCAAVTRGDDPATYLVVTAFETAFSYEVLDLFAVAAGYVNVEQQPGPDGQRRNIFYAPGAQFYVSLIGYLDAIYLSASGGRQDVSHR